MKLIGTYGPVVSVFTALRSDIDISICLYIPSPLTNKKHCVSPPLMAQQPLVGQGLFIIEVLRSHSGIWHSVGLLWTSDQPDEETSTWQHTTLTTDRHPCPRQDSNPQSQQVNSRRPTPWTARPLGSADIVYAWHLPRFRAVLSHRVPVVAILLHMVLHMWQCLTNWGITHYREILKCLTAALNKVSKCL
jgi:hypothetical protein